MALLARKVIRRELTVLHLLLLTCGKVMIGIGIGLLIAQSTLPWGYPLIALGVIILLPTIIWLMKGEKREAAALKAALRKA